jgi:hypothetical protein
MYTCVYTSIKDKQSGYGWMCESQNETSQKLSDSARLAIQKKTTESIV